MRPANLIPAPTRHHRVLGIIYAVGYGWKNCFGQMTYSLKKRLFQFVNRCSLEIHLPFFRKVLIATAVRGRIWFNLSIFLIAVHSLRRLFQPVFLNFDEDHQPGDFSFQPEIGDLRKLCHKEINLYEVTIYQICVDLQVFISDVDLSNPDHFKVVQKWFHKAVGFINYILPYFQKPRIAKVIIFQGHLYDSAILRWICIDKGVPIVAVENTFNSDKFIWDDIACISVNKNLAPNFFWRYRDVVDTDTARTYGTKYLNSIKSKKQNEHCSPDKILQLDHGRKSIFYIGQVFTDASTLFGIGNFHSPVSIINYLVNYAISENYNLIIKLHPKELSGTDICQNRYDSLTHRQILANTELYDRIDQHDQIYYDNQNTYDTYSIIKNADVCVTINSQAGLESLLLGKTVITCGNAFYNCLDSSYQANDIHHLGFLLDGMLKNQAPRVNMNQVYTFFYIFCEKYCLPKTERSFLQLFNKNIHYQRSVN